jgi:hypothetical protein
MAEYMSFTLEIMRSELAARRRRMEAECAGRARLIAGEKLVLRQRRALVLAPPSWVAPVAAPSRSRAYADSESAVPT